MNRWVLLWCTVCSRCRMGHCNGFEELEFGDIILYTKNDSERRQCVSLDSRP